MTQFVEGLGMPHLSTAERVGRREGRKEGREEEAQTAILEFLEISMGTVPADLAGRVTQITDLRRLRSLRRLLFSGVPLAEFEQALANT